MSDTNRNALKELAENLEHDNFFGCDHFKQEIWIDQAQRIIFELSNVGYWKSTGRTYAGDSVDAVSKCIAIAEEGSR